MIVKVPRNHIFITQQLRDRADLKDVKKYKEHFTFDAVLEKLKKMGIKISDNVIITDTTDSIAKLDVGEKSSHIFAAGFSTDGESTDGKRAGHFCYIDHFTKQGVPIILVSDEESFCDFVLLDFDKSVDAKPLNKVAFECLKTSEFKESCPFKEKYCENKEIFSTYPQLIIKSQFFSEFDLKRAA